MTTRESVGRGKEVVREHRAPRTRAVVLPLGKHERELAPQHVERRDRARVAQAGDRAREVETVPAEALPCHEGGK